jgi:hypothetical protein
MEEEDMEEEEKEEDVFNEEKAAKSKIEDASPPARTVNGCLNQLLGL